MEKNVWVQLLLSTHALHLHGLTHYCQPIWTKPSTQCNTERQHYKDIILSPCNWVGTQILHFPSSLPPSPSSSSLSLFPSISLTLHIPQLQLSGVEWLLWHHGDERKWPSLMTDSAKRVITGLQCSAALSLRLSLSLPHAGTIHLRLSANALHLLLCIQNSWRTRRTPCMPADTVQCARVPTHTVMWSHWPKGSE